MGYTQNKRCDLGKISLDTCVFSNLYTTYRACQRLGKDVFNQPGLSDKNRQQLKFYVELLFEIRCGNIVPVMLPTVKEELGVKNREPQSFLDLLGVEVADVDPTLVEEMKNLYIKKRAIKISKKSNNPYNDVKILIESYLAGARLLTADVHFTDIKKIDLINNMFEYNIGHIDSKLLPIHVDQFAKTIQHKTFIKEHDISKQLS